MITLRILLSLLFLFSCGKGDTALKSESISSVDLNSINHINEPGTYAVSGTCSSPSPTGNILA